MSIPSAASKPASPVPGDHHAALDAAPTDPVRVGLLNPDSSEWALDTDVLEFLPGAGLSQTFTITGVDDSEVDGDISGVVGLSPVVSDDPRYQGIDPADVPVINRDDDVSAVPQWQLEAVDLEVSESGDTGLLRIAFDQLPSADVHVEILSGDTSEVVVDPVELVFSATNATTLQAVVLHGLDDDIADGTREVSLTIRVSASTDADFASLPAQSLNAQNLDDDSASISLNLVGSDQLLEGDSTNLQLALGSQPLAPVEFALMATVEAPDGADDASVELVPMNIVIDPANWRQPVPLALNTFDNGAVNTRRVIAIHVDAITTSDPIYAALLVAPALVTLDDRDTQAGNPPTRFPDLDRWPCCHFSSV